MKTYLDNVSWFGIVLAQNKQSPRTQNAINLRQNLHNLLAREVVEPLIHCDEVCSLIRDVPLRGHNIRIIDRNEFSEWVHASPLQDYEEVGGVRLRVVRDPHLAAHAQCVAQRDDQLAIIANAHVIVQGTDFAKFGNYGKGLLRQFVLLLSQLPQLVPCCAQFPGTFSIEIKIKIPLLLVLVYLLSFAQLKFSHGACESFAKKKLQYLKR